MHECIEPIIVMRASTRFGASSAAGHRPIAAEHFWHAAQFGIARYLLTDAPVTMAARSSSLSGREETAVRRGSRSAFIIRSSLFVTLKTSEAGRVVA